MSVCNYLVFRFKYFNRVMFLLLSWSNRCLFLYPPRWSEWLHTFLIFSFSPCLSSRRRTASTTSLHRSSSVWKMENTQMAEVCLSLSGYCPTQRTMVPCGRRVWPVNGCSALSLLSQCGSGCNEPVVESQNHQLLPETLKRSTAVCSDYNIRICDRF